MRRLSVLAALAAATLIGSSAWALIPGTAHDQAVAAGSAGACAACHIPHGGTGARGWASTAGGTNVVGEVAPLCQSCHGDAGTGYGATFAGAYSMNYVYNLNSHGVFMNMGNMPWGTDVANSGLEYGATAATTGYFECTTCHDVHDDTVRPFLREDLDSICARCHTDRHYVGAVLSEGGTVTPGAWGIANVGNANPGSHPVGNDITGDVSGGTSDIAIPATTFDIVRSPTVEGWVLGGKLFAGGVTCVTCHAVHGAQGDTDTTAGNQPGTDAPPNANYLTIAQLGPSAAWTNPGGGGSPRTVANGNGGTNALCEGCHGTGNLGGVAYGGTFAVNPGGAANFTHPVDDMDAQYDAGVTAFGTNWPVGGGTAGTNVSPIPICESCHLPHPSAELAGGGGDGTGGPRADVLAGAAAFILRAPAIDVCGVCHTADLANHHPANVTYDSSDVAYLPGATGGAGDTLTCGTCHGGSGGGAHNWSGAGVLDMAASWLPANNGRDLASQANDMFAAGLGQSCMDCHYTMDSQAGSRSPTMNTAGSTFTPAEPEYQPAATAATNHGTHYLGALREAVTSWRSAVGTNGAIDFTATTTTWSGAGVTGGALGWSRFQGADTATTANVVCETCHELEPDKNSGINHLLLAPYIDGTNGENAGVDALCVACHGIPPGTHPTTGVTVTRTDAVLNASSAYVRGTLLGYATMDQTANNYLSCDSCHQPHNANPNSATFIIDAPNTVDFGGASGVQNTVGAGAPDATLPEQANGMTGTTGSGTTYAPPTLAGRGGDFTGFCDQCHLYAY